MCKCVFHVACESRCIYVLFGSKLMPRLPYDGIDNVQTRNLIFRFTFQNELLDILNDVFIELNCFQCTLSYRTHFRFTNGHLKIVEREELRKRFKGKFIFTFYLNWITINITKAPHRVIVNNFRALLSCLSGNFTRI